MGQLKADEKPAETAEEAAKDTEASEPAAEQTAAPAPARKSVLRKIMYVITAVFALMAAAAVTLVVHVHSMVDECKNTELPQNMTAEETLRQYFKYWDDGNNMGMQLAALPESGADTVKWKNYVFELDLLCDIKLTGCKELTESDWRYSGCYDSAAYEVTFTYNSRFGAGNNKFLEGENTGWRFYLAKITKDDDWRIYSVIKNYE